MLAPEHMHARAISSPRSATAGTSDDSQAAGTSARCAYCSRHVVRVWRHAPSRATRARQSPPDGALLPRARVCGNGTRQLCGARARGGYVWRHKAPAEAARSDRTAHPHGTGRLDQGAQHGPALISLGLCGSGGGSARDTPRETGIGATLPIFLVVVKTRRLPCSVVWQQAVGASHLTPRRARARNVGSSWGTLSLAVRRVHTVCTIILTT